MNQEEHLEKAIQLIQAGERAQAQRLLTEILSADSRHEGAWLWLAVCVDQVERKRYCLQKILGINPTNEQARRQLQELDAAAAEVPIPAPEVAETILTSLEEPQTKPVEAVASSAKSLAEAPLAAASLPPEGATPAIEPSPAETAPQLQVPAKKKRPLLSATQSGCLLLLALVLLLGLGGMVYWLWQAGILEFPGATNPLDSGGANAPVVAMQLPPTWTPLPTPTPTVSPMPAPTSTATPPPSPMPSITPLSSQRRIVIGRSVKNRPIEVYRFGFGKDERMIVAGVHGGDEWNTIALADELIAYLGKNPDLVPPEITLYILRSLNPDGEAVGRSPDGRANANGVDLNRNFDANWKANWARSGCWAERPITAGEKPASEPETQALVNFLSERRVKVLLNYHSEGLGIFPSGNPPDPSSVRLAQAIAGVSGYQYPPVKTSCEFTGTLVDWALGQAIIAVDIELPEGDATDFEANLEILKLLLTWAQ